MAAMTWRLTRYLHCLGLPVIRAVNRDCNGVQPWEKAISSTRGIATRYECVGKASKMRPEAKSPFISGTCWLEWEFLLCARSQELLAKIASRAFRF